MKLGMCGPLWARSQQFGNAGCQHGVRMFPGEVEWVPTQKWDDSEGGRIWDMH